MFYIKKENLPSEMIRVYTDMAVGHELDPVIRNQFVGISGGKLQELGILRPDSREVAVVGPWKATWVGR